MPPVSDRPGMVTIVGSISNHRPTDTRSDILRMERTQGGLERWHPQSHGPEPPPQIPHTHKHAPRRLLAAAGTIVALLLVLSTGTRVAWNEDAVMKMLDSALSCQTLCRVKRQGPLSSHKVGLLHPRWTWLMAWYRCW